ncbi:hypothetical protein AQUCO_03600140v1 [Aquilegia coerulea]|uniref:Uncharacterized protein n=1 Tax=Aquilegia coerulea TaxID=218851 RepID=A0A2G5CVF3_AQUCA|nr:hypothetical protein AQUCO_03600140v1 [Aquilegia coerulea]
MRSMFTTKLFQCQCCRLNSTTLIHFQVTKWTMTRNLFLQFAGEVSLQLWLLLILQEILRSWRWFDSFLKKMLNYSI